MQKVEKWRIQELTLILNDLSILLKKGNDHEWANIMFHFRDEANKIQSASKFDLDNLKKLVSNIGNCFTETSHFRELHLGQREFGSDLNSEFQKAKAQLLRILSEIKYLFAEYVS
jgi:hypothetical protein